VRILHSIVQPSSHFTPIFDAHFARRRLVRFEPIGDDLKRITMMLQGFLEEPQSRRFISFLGDIALEHLTLVIDGPPEVVSLAVDLHENLIKVPAPMAETSHPAGPLPLDVSREQGTESVPPEPHGLMANVHPSREQQILSGPQR
jgi:hypothetical protein